MKGDKLGRRQGGSGTQEQPRMEITEEKETNLQDKAAAAAKSSPEITKGDKLGRQGGSSSQEQPRMEIAKGNTFALCIRDMSVQAGGPQPLGWRELSALQASTVKSLWNC